MGYVDFLRKLDTTIIYQIARLAIWHDLFLEFWFVGIWFFCSLNWPTAVIRFENVPQLNIRRDKKLSLQLSHRQIQT